MNRQGKGKIGWTDWSWNPIVGCLHNCWYCYAKRLAIRFPKNFPNGFKPTFYPERLKELKKRKKTAKIFVCSIADLFAPWTKPEWTQAVLDEIQKPEYNHLIFQLLTKQPKFIKNFNLAAKENIWVGITITHQPELERGMLHSLARNYKGLKFISFEPLLGKIDLPLEDRISRQIDWMIIGKLTGSKKVPLQKEWVEELIDDAQRLDIPIFIKDNVKWVVEIQEFPYKLSKKL